MTADKIQSSLQQEFSDNPMLLESCENRWPRLSLDIDHTHLSPGGTFSGPTMILLADTSMYAAILTTIPLVLLDMTTNLKINFLCKAEPHHYFLGEYWLLKLGKRLIVGEVIIYSQDEPEPAPHVTCTYSIHPQSIQIKVQN